MLKLNLLTLAMMIAMTGGQAHAQTSTTATQMRASMSSDSGADMVGVPGCHFGEKIDASTAQDAQQFLKSAGYSSITGLKKSCDNNWHGQAMYNGAAVNVMVTPEGQVIQEGS